MAASPAEAPTATDEPEPPRLALAEAFYSGPLDGAWWPRSRDLQREAPILVDGFPADRGRISRLLVSPPDWDRTGAHVIARRGQVNIGRFPGDDVHVVVLSLGGGTRLRLLVIDPGTNLGTAQTLMREASAPGNRRDAGALLAAC